MKTLLIVLITSLFWAIGIWVDRNYSDTIKAEIREWVNEDGEKFEKSRERYIINGHWLYVGDSIQCAFKVYEKEGITYLELYGDDDYAGKYRKS